MSLLLKIKELPAEGILYVSSFNTFFLYLKKKKAQLSLLSTTLGLLSLEADIFSMRDPLGWKVILLLSLSTKHNYARVLSF